MKIAIVGGGIFGVSSAWMLAKAGFSVELFEKKSNIMQAASQINQYRLHRGYHYPRSKETVILSLKGEPGFRYAYGDALINNGINHYYCVAKENSLSDAMSCENMWRACDLEFKETILDIANQKMLEKTYEVKEHLFDPHILKEICEKYLMKYNVSVHLNTKARIQDLQAYDLVVVATYTSNNDLLSDFPHLQREYQFELCEKPVLKLPDKFAKKSVVVIDGPFMCFDPYANTPYHVMGNVDHAIHLRTFGKKPTIPDMFIPLLNNGVIENPPITNIEYFLACAEKFFPGISNAKHIGSMYTIRTVLPNREHDDARPTMVEIINKKLITLFSGKIGTCIDAAEQVVQFAKYMNAV